MSDKPLPARVKALAMQIMDEPLSWNERADGSIVIVFCNKGKHTFAPDPQIPAAPARAEGQEAEQRIPAPDPVSDVKPKPKSKRRNHGNTKPS